MIDLDDAHFRKPSISDLAALGMSGQNVVSAHWYDVKSPLGGHHPFVMVDGKKINYKGRDPLVDGDILYVEASEGQNRMPERQAAKPQPALV